MKVEAKNKPIHDSRTSSRAKSNAPALFTLPALRSLGEGGSIVEGPASHEVEGSNAEAAGNLQRPAPRLGNKVDNVPYSIERLYEEARDCTGVGAYTAAVLACRKLLMNITVDHGAKKGQPFIEYIEYLAKKGYVPPNGQQWVNHIRQKGNEANHEIALMAEGDAVDLITFIEMLLKFIYEFPAKIPKDDVS